MDIGRDFIRSLMDLTHIAEFKSIWDDLNENPTALHRDFQGLYPVYVLVGLLIGIHSFLRVPTPTGYILSRITPWMEHKLTFLFKQVYLIFHPLIRNIKVKYRLSTIYMNWFAAKHLNTQNLLNAIVFADIARYVLYCCHPSNEVLASDVIQRYQFLARLLKQQVLSPLSY